MKTQPLTSIIVVNYNGGSDLHDCLESVVQRTKCSYELIVVDNASTDGSLDGIQDKFHDMQVVRNKENQGYSAAVNRGLERVSGEYVAVLNMDVIVEEGWLESMVRFLEENPHAGAVNPLLLIHQDSEEINALGQIIQWSGLGFNRKLRWPRGMADKVPTRISGLQGAVFVIRGGEKLFYGGAAESMALLAGLGVPWPSALSWAIGLLELLCGLALLLGVLTSYAAMSLALEMAAAALLVHLPRGFFVEDGGFEYALVLAASCFALALAGGGPPGMQQGGAGTRGS